MILIFFHRLSSGRWVLQPLPSFWESVHGCGGGEESTAQPVPAEETGEEARTAHLTPSPLRESPLLPQSTDTIQYVVEWLAKGVRECERDMERYDVSSYLQTDDVCNALWPPDARQFPTWTYLPIMAILKIAQAYKGFLRMAGLLKVPFPKGNCRHSLRLF